MEQIKKIALMGSLVFALSACSGNLAFMKASPAPDSGFIRWAGPSGSQNEQFPFHRTWTADDAMARMDRRPAIHVAPIDLSRLEAAPIRKVGALKPKEAQSVAEYTRAAVIEALQSKRRHGITVADRSGRGTLTLELALVELRPSDVARSVVATAASAFVPGAGLLSVGSQGTAAIEGQLWDPDRDTPVMQFADRESGKLAPVNLNDYTRFSHAHVIIDDWARQIAEIIANSARTKVADSSPVTLAPV